MVSKHLTSISTSKPFIDTKPITVEPNTIAFDAINLMQQTQASCLLIVNQQQLVGLFKERDVLQTVLAGTNLRAVEIAALMATKVPTLVETSVDNPISVLRLMQQQGVDHLPVVNSFNHVVGLISKDSLYQALRLEDLLFSKQQAEERYSSLFENSIEGIFQTTLDGRYLRANSTLAKMHGYASPQEMVDSINNIGQQLYVNPDRRAEFIRLIEESEVIRGFESQVYCKDGSTIWISENVWAVRDEQGKVLYYEGTSVDITDRKRIEAERREAELALQASEMRFRHIYENAPAMMHSLDESGRLRYVNRKWLEVTGYGLEEVVGEKIINFMASESAEDYQLKAPKFWQECYATDLSYQYIKKDGSIMDAVQNCIAIVTPEGDRISISVVQDVTEQLQTQRALQQLNAELEARVNHRTAELTNTVNQLQQEIRNRQQVEISLRESEIRFQQLAKSVPGMIFQYVLYPDGTEALLYASPACQEIYEVSVEAALQDVNLLWQQFLSEDLQAGRAAVLRSFETFEPYSFEGRIITPSGQLKWVQFNSRPQKQPDESVVWVGIAIDITERKQIGEALRRSEARFRKLAANVPGMIYQYVQYVDGSDALTYVSSACQDIFEIAAERALEDNSIVWEMIHPDNVQSVLQSIEISARNFEPRHTEYRIVTPSGQLKWLQSISRPEKQLDGSIVWDGIVVDITERKQMEEALRQSEARFQLLAANVPGVIYQYIQYPDGSDTFAYISPSCLDIHEVSAEMAMQDARTIMETVHPDDRQAHQNTFIVSAKTLKPRNLEFRIITPSGRFKWLQGSSRSKKQPEGSLVWDGIVIDITERKLAEEALRQSEERLRAIFEQSGVGISLADPAGKYLQVNQAFCNLLGYTEAELLETTYWNLTHPDDLGLEREVYRQIQTAWMGAFSCQKRYVHKHGHAVWVNVHITKVYSANGKVQFSVAIIEDITIQKQAQEALRQSEEMFRQLAENIQNVFWMTTPDGTKTIYVSPAYEQLWGRSCDSLYACSHSWLDAVHPDDRQDVIAALPLQPYGRFDQEFRVIRPDGEIRWIRDRAFPIYTPEGELYRIAGICEDITYHKQTQAIIQQSEERFRLLFDESPVAICLADQNYRIVNVNQALCQMLGYTHEELVQMSFIDYTYPEDLTEDLYYLDKIHDRSLSCYQMEKRFISKDGELIWAHLTVVPIYDQDSNFLYTLGTIQNITERKWAENALRESEERFRLIANSAPVYLWVDGPNMDCQFINQTGLDFMGYTMEELQGNGWRTVIHPEDYVRCQKTYLQSFRNRESFSTEYRVRRVDGEYRWLLDTGVPRFLSDGTFAGFIGCCVDISDRKHAEEALRESEQRFRTMADSAPVLLWMSDLNGLNFFNQSWLNFTGRSLEQEYGNGWLEGVHPEDRQRYVDTYLEASCACQTFTIEYRLKRADGEYRWILDTGAPRFLPDGTFAGYIGSCIDISDRKQAEAALRQSGERLRTVLQNMPVMLDAFDEEGNIIVWNQECERVTGYTADEITHNPKALEILYPDSEYRQAMLVEWSKRNNDYRDWEWNITCKDGTTKTIAWSNISREFPIPDWGPWAVGMDVSDRKKAEAEILKALERERELNELKSQFISMVSHEFRTPLSTILSSTELLQRYGNRWAEDKQQLRYQLIIQSVDQMTQLLNHVLIMGRAEAGRLPFNPASLDLVHFCNVLLEEFQLNTKEPHVLKFSYEGDRNFFYLDAQLLRHILTNLISNAIKYSPQGSTVDLRLIGQNQEVVFQVQDQGIGILTEDQEELFTVFKRGSNVGTISGTGLGLAIAKQCVDLHKGSITVESEVGKGTLVTVKLPDVRH